MLVASTVAPEGSEKRSFQLRSSTHAKPGSSLNLLVKKERKEKEDVLDKVHEVLQVSKKKVTPDVLVEGESSVSINSGDLEALHSESNVSNSES
uniref:Uncharacterized protein n=1 Tax=Lactuca sativa TaxID=4236 RepID=A0A9R1VR93_LACSA|nr:hypothetical protein LSAT_V11C400193110 [Lactuca sativa]